MQYVNNKYLKNVGIFIKWPIDDDLLAQKQNLTDFNYLWLVTFSTNKKTFRHLNLFISNRLSDITEVIKKPYMPLKIRTDFNSVKQQNYTICIRKFSMESCFLIKDAPNAVESNPERATHLDYEYNLHLTKEPAQKFKYIIGFIDYNIKLNDLTVRNANESCTDLSASSMIYAKYNGLVINGNHTFMKQAHGRLSFYNYLDDLISVDKFWKTGIAEYKMTGDLGPKMNKQIRLIC